MGKDTFTLLADDQSSMANSADALPNLKAHLVLLALTNDHVVVSDSFLINNANLRRLAQSDDVIRHLISSGVLQIALRREAVEHENGLIRLKNEFASATKLRETVRDLSDDGLKFIQQNGEMRPWDLQKVSGNYTELCAKALYSQKTFDLLGDRQLDILRDAIQSDFDGIVQRSFIYNDAAPLLDANGFPLDARQKEHLKLCVDAPYHSNLPNLLGLNPAYDAETQPSFELMRGVELVSEEIDKGRELPDRLDAKHYVYGLTAMPYSEIEAIRNSFEFKQFVKAFSELDDPETVEDSFYHLEVAIQAGILSCFPELQSRSSIVAKRKLVKRFHEFKSDKTSRISDVISFGVGLAGLSLPPGVGYCASHMLDYVRGHHNESAAKRAPDDIATHKKEVERLRRYFEKKGLTDRMGVSEQIVETKSHGVETFIANI